MNVKKSILIAIIVWLSCIIIWEFVYYFLHSKTYLGVFFASIAALSNTAIAFLFYQQLPPLRATNKAAQETNKAAQETNKAAQETAKANFLALLMGQWMEEDMVLARCLLHEQALLGKTTEEAKRYVSDFVIALSKSKDPSDIRDFSRIISLLEYMETLATFYESGHISMKNLQKLFGGSLERYFYYLEGYILFRRAHGSPPGVVFSTDKVLYKSYELLVQDLMQTLPPSS